jgi:hypothetical protein
MRNFLILEEGVPRGWIKPTKNLFSADYTIELDGWHGTMSRASKNISMFPEVNEMTLTLVSGADLVTGQARYGWGATKALGINFRYRDTGYLAVRLGYLKYSLIEKLQPTDAAPICLTKKGNFWGRKLDIDCDKNVSGPVTAFFLLTCVLRMRSPNP